MDADIKVSRNCRFLLDFILELSKCALNDEFVLNLIHPVEATLIEEFDAKFSCVSPILPVVEDEAQGLPIAGVVEKVAVGQTVDPG